jgi:Transposase DDE domain
MPSAPHDPTAACPRSLGQLLKDFLTPQVLKQAHQANPRRRHEHQKRWGLQAVLTVLLLACWSQGDSLPEKFETARACYVALHPRRRQPGRTFSGFRKALARLPMPVLHALARAVRGRVVRLLAGRWHTDGFVLVGCDGSRLECPRTEALERALGLCAKPTRPKKSGKGRAKAPMSQPALWLTALVHLASGVPLAWLLGRGDASEQRHLQRLAAVLPAAALVITDAGYRGFALLRTLLDGGADFLIRLSSATTVYTLEHRAVRHFRDGQLVYYWPVRAQKGGLAPVPGRLIRVPGKKRRHDVWLLTSVLDPARLSAAQAGRYYKMRWGSEGFFRTYKRTLGQLKLRCDTPRLAFREAEVALVGAQVLLCQGALAVPAPAGEAVPAYSPRKVLVAFRREVSRLAAPRLRVRFGEELAGAERERRPGRHSGKVSRRWPQRKPHKPPKPPKVLTLTKKQKDLLARHERLE